MRRHSLIFVVEPISKEKAEWKSTNIKGACTISNKFCTKDLISFVPMWVHWSQSNYADVKWGDAEPNPRYPCPLHDIIFLCFITNTQAKLIFCGSGYILWYISQRLGDTAAQLTSRTGFRMLFQTFLPQNCLSVRWSKKMKKPISTLRQFQFSILT